MLQIFPYYAQIMPDYAPLCSLDLLLSEFKDESISLINLSISKQLRALNFKSST